jgi:leucyl-tRNA synthetase
MSKSKSNTVDPARIIETYGADTARWFMLNDSPPDRDMEWTADGVDGAHRFLQRLWRQVTEAVANLPPAGTPPPGEMSEAARALRQASHKNIQAVTEDVELFRFNRAVARLHELSNSLGAFKAQDESDFWAQREACEILVQLSGPMIPHLAEELWRRLGHQDFLVDRPWPDASPALIMEESVTVAVQVNGKLRATIALPRDAADGEAERAALAEPGVRRAMGDKDLRKVVVVKNRVVNVVV